MRIALALLAALSLATFSPASSVWAQSAFDPEPVAYALCVTNEMKRVALVHPPLSQDAIIARAFRACAEVEMQFRSSLRDKGLSTDDADQRVSLVQKFIRQNAPDDIDRFRINQRPR